MMRPVRLPFALLAGFLALAVSSSVTAASRPDPGAAASRPDPAASPPARGGLPPPPILNARAAVVIDAATGTLLYAKNPDLPIPPASLAKLVTLHLVYQDLAAGRLDKDEIVTIDKRDCSPYIPYGSSLMYLKPGMRVSVLDLMRGAAVVSGNDAAFALARRIAGSNEAFAIRMNAAVRAMGLKTTYLVEPSGLSELNRTTAREFASFCKRYLELHPDSLSELHSIRYIEFPRLEHATAEYRPSGRIVQYNRNDLVLSYPGCDGFKTGFIIEAGYNLAATAVRGASRFILVTLGGSGEGPAGGGAVQRSHDGAALLDWTFASFVTLEPPVGPVAPVRAWYGAERWLRLVPADKAAVTLPKSQASSLSVRVEMPRWIDAPLSKGAKVGEIVYTAQGVVHRRVDLVAESDIPRGNIVIVALDAVAKFFSRLFGAS